MTIAKISLHCILKSMISKPTSEKISHEKNKPYENMVEKCDQSLFIFSETDKSLFNVNNTERSKSLTVLV